MVYDDFPTNLIDFNDQFNSEEACLLYIRKQLWGSETGFECPKCKHNKAWQCKTRDILYCAACNHQVSVTSQTMFRNTRKPLRKWFMAMYHVTSSKRGMSAKELQKQLGLKSYQTAWAWLHKIRRAMVDPNRNPLSGAIEIDETYCGGLADGSARGRSVLKKTVVACAVEKNGNKCGRVRLGVMTNASSEKLKAFIEGKIEKESTLHSDGWRGYNGIERSGYVHIRTIISEQEEKAHVYFPRVHRVFSLLKSWILGTHHGAVSRKHLQSYLEEYTFRFNRRNAKKITHSFQRLMEGAVREPSLPY